MKDSCEKKIQYSVCISPVLHNKLDQHLLVLRKILKFGLTKQDWLVEAVQEKLLRDTPERDIEKNKRINLRMDQLTNKLLEQRINLIRPFHNSYSKKKLLLDAIQERLDQEEGVVKQQLADYQASLRDMKEAGD